MNPPPRKGVGSRIRIKFYYFSIRCGFLSRSAYCYGNRCWKYFIPAEIFCSFFIRFLWIGFHDTFFLVTLLAFENPFIPTLIRELGGIFFAKFLPFFNENHLSAISVSFLNLWSLLILDLFFVTFCMHAVRELNFQGLHLMNVGGIIGVYLPRVALKTGWSVFLLGLN